MAQKQDLERIWNDFQDAVNMTPASLDTWLNTDDSRESGWKEDGGDETIGHHSGRRIVEIKRKKKDELTQHDYEHMRKVIGFVHRHLKQGGPKDDKEHSPWRHSLMNWGHDPLKND
jgi:hypothetical protein